ncbi:hypothetical protein Bca101_047804 [Brassica carinata]
MAETETANGVKENKLWKGVFAVSGIMSTLVIYGVLQEKIMRVPYGLNKEFFKYSLFLVFCNRLTTSAVSAGALLASKKVLDPALKYVSFPVQTLAKCAKMIPVMVWGTLIMQKKFKGFDYLVTFLVTLGCSVFILFPVGLYPFPSRFESLGDDVSPYNKGRENTVWGVSLMAGYLGFDGFTSTFQDKLFKGYNMEIHNQIFYTTLCSCVLSFTGLTLQGQLLLAVDFVSRHRDCLVDIALLSTFALKLPETNVQVATASQFFISYTIRTFGALTFAAIMTTRQLASIMLSCIWFSHPLSWEQCMGSVIVFGSLYAKNLLNNNKRTEKQPPPPELPQYEKPEGS